MTRWLARQKEWRTGRSDGEQRCSWVMLPTEKARGELYETFEAAREAAVSFADDRAGDESDAVEMDATAPPEPATEANADLRRWS